jgi:hypothetical protein
MHTYEKPPGSHSRGPNYAGLIVVACLLVAMFATWAIMKTSLGATASPTAKLAQSDRAQ